MIGHKDWFSSLYKSTYPTGQVHLDDDTPYDIQGIGDVSIHLGKNNFQVKEVLYVLDVTNNLLSFIHMLDHDMKLEFDIVKGKKVYYIHDKSQGGKIMVIAIGVGKMFLLDVFSLNNQALNVCVIYVTILWHYIYGHMNPDYLITLQKNELVHGLPYLVSPSNICSTYIA